MIGGVVAFAIAHVAKYILDWVAAKTGCCAIDVDDPAVAAAEARMEDFSLKPDAGHAAHHADLAPQPQVLLHLLPVSNKLTHVTCVFS